MVFPSHVLRLIREYSLPITRANWRKSKPVITPFNLYAIIRKRRRNILKYRPIYFMVLNNIEDTDWYYTCAYIQKYGLDKYYDEYFRQYGVKYVQNIRAIEGVTDAINTFNWLHKNI